VNLSSWIALIVFFVALNATVSRDKAPYLLTLLLLMASVLFLVWKLRVLG